jgi:hypothetical protein
MNPSIAIQPGMLRLLLAFGALAMLPAPAVAQSQSSNSNAAVREVVVRTQGSETLKQLALRTLIDAGDLERVARRNKLRSATTPLPAGTAVKLPVDRMITTALTARVASTASGVQVRLASGLLRPLQVEQELSESDVVIAPASGSALLVLPDQSRVQVAPKSEVALQRLRKVVATEIYQIELNVVSGTAEASVTPRRTAGSAFNIRTRRAVTGIRGTSLRVSDLGDTGTTEVLTGAVEVANPAGVAIAVPAGKGTFVNAAGKVAPPVSLLAAPDIGNSATRYERLTMDIAFADLAGAAQYRTRVVADSPAGPVVMAEGVSTKPVVSLNAPPDGSYRLVARAIDANGLEGFEAAQPIVIKARPVPPAALSPQPQQILYAPEVTFRWAQPEGVSSYNVEVQRLEAGELSEKPVITLSGHTSTQHASAPLEPGRYRWRLASIAMANGQADTGPRSDWLPFQIEAPPALAAQPTGTEGAVKLTWTGLADARYVLDLARDAQFKQTVLTRQVSGLSTELTGLEPAVFFLRVRRDEPGAAFGPAQRISLVKLWRTGTGGELTSADGNPIEQR